MDTDDASARSRAHTGGAVEPANPAALIRDRLRKPDDEVARRYELRDPFAEVTYRADSVREITARAEQIGSSRFVAIDADGRRTVVNKANGEWRRESAPAQVAPQKPEAERNSGPIPIARVLPLADPVQRSNARPEGLEQSQADPQAERAIAVAKLEAVLVERYLIKRAPVLTGDVTLGRTEYRFRGDTTRIAFTESAFKLATDSNSPSVARSMVDVADARNWRGVRVSGHEDFKRLVWLEATVRGVKSIGYEPHPADLEILQREQDSRRSNRIEPSQAQPGSADKAASGRGGGGRKTVLAAIEAVLIAKRVPEARREAVLASAAEKLAQHARDGRMPKVKVYDAAAPSRRTVATPTRDVDRGRERAAPSR